MVWKSWLYRSRLIVQFSSSVWCRQRRVNLLLFAVRTHSRFTPSMIELNLLWRRNALPELLRINRNDINRLSEGKHESQRKDKSICNKIKCLCNRDVGHFCFETEGHPGLIDVTVLFMLEPCDLLWEHNFIRPLRTAAPQRSVPYMLYELKSVSLNSTH